MKKGSMISFKKLLGGAVMLAGFGIAMIDSIKELMLNHPLITGAVLIIAGYFLMKSGSQR